MNIVRDVLARLKVGTETSYRNLTLFPLLDVRDGEPDYLTLDEALARHCVEITEISKLGSVNNLRLTNKSERGVLLLDGEELVGAKQNRVLNLTILAPAMQTMTIPVTCVERGRWAYCSKGFSSSRQTLTAFARAMKSTHVAYSRLRTGRPDADQVEIWNEIEQIMMRMEADSPTEAMADVYDQHEASLSDYERAFEPLEGQMGVLFAINGQIVGLDLFDYEATLRRFFPKLVRSYALDAIDLCREPHSSALRSEVETFLNQLMNAQMNTFPGVGEGKDVRLRAPDITGAALVARNRVIHLSAFRGRGKNPKREEDLLCCDFSRPIHTGASRER